MTNCLVTAALILAIQGAESQDRGDAIYGDQGRSHGVLQIQRGVIHDVNKVYGTRYTLRDAHDQSKARKVCALYLQHWGRRYQAKTGRAPTPEVLARIWNGGPRGYQRSTTYKYWIDRVRPRLRAGKALSV
jgi:hypothetical protein